MKKNRIPSEADHRTVQARRRYGALVLTVLACAAMTCPALAADDPLTIVGNLSDFVFSIIKALGVIILGWGIVQVGMSIQSHDASQRTQGFLCLFGLCQGNLDRHWRGVTEKGQAMEPAPLTSLEKRGDIN